MRLIDADATRGELWMAGVNTEVDGVRGVWVRFKEIEKIFDNAPTADPVKHGRWITSYYVINNGTKSRAKVSTECKCSVCGGVFGRMSDLFCYRCGARMDGENDEID